jgi:ethanolamine permease
MLWGLGVGYVISGNYFGWNLGLEAGGTLGLGIAIIFIIILAITFTFSYTELACAIPKAGGVFDYASRAFGKDVGFIAGMAQNIEFIFAPPAIAFAIGAYVNLFLPNVPVLVISMIAYFLFTGLNIFGVKTAAVFELVVTIVAVGGLLLFSFVTLPHFDTAMMMKNSFPKGTSGIFAALPFAIWFFLGIEGVANVAEETIDPQRTILLGFGSAIVTLVILCVLTFLGAVGIAGWERVVYLENGVVSDSPLPLAMALAQGSGSVLYSALIIIGLFGLVASFHGIILAAGRSSFEFGRVKFAPTIIGKIHPRFQTPANALVVNMIIGIMALLTGKTGEIITISVFGALTLYIISVVTLLRLRKSEPSLVRPFKVPLYPFFPIIAFVIASVSLIALTIYNIQLALIYFLIVGISFLIFKLRYKDQ